MADSAIAAHAATTTKGSGAPEHGLETATPPRCETPPTPDAPRAGRLRRNASRIAATASSALLLSLFILPAVAPPAPALASRSSSSCGTNWTSRTTPPKTIRVYVAEKHRVVVKDFRSYVPMVMASGEFPSRLPEAVLEAGAVAVKQYAWYYALKGNHRPGYRTASGVCYDVRNDTSDQLFRPAAHPTPKQQHAVDATWGLTLRKGDRFFLTGYRAGSSSTCGADADGWRLYQRSASNCAKQGWSRQRIQAYYYSPRINFVWNGAKPQPVGKDTTAPDVVVPEVVPARKQPSDGRVGVTVRWSASDKSGIGSYRLQEKIANGAWKRVKLDKARQTSINVMTHPGQRYQFRVRAQDSVGNRSDWIGGPSFGPQVVQSESAALVGAWSNAAKQTALGGTLSSTAIAGPRAHLWFRASSIGLVASRGKTSGKVRIFVDGKLLTVIDLRAKKDKERRVVFTHAWRTPSTHSITVEALGTHGRPRVDIDAFILLR